jgi:hypothetical protein
VYKFKPLTRGEFWGLEGKTSVWEYLESAYKEIDRLNEKLDRPTGIFKTWVGVDRV